MTGRGFVLQPEVESILQEIARDPRSTLLRVKRPAVRRGYLETLEPVSARKAGLTAAERELLDVHRDEVGYLLAEKTLALFLAEPPRGLAFDVRKDTEDPNAVLDGAEWASRAQDVLDHPVGEPAPGGAREILERCLGETRIEPEAVVDVALRLRPVPLHLQHKALCALHIGHPYSALSTASRLINDPRKFMVSFSLDVVASALREMGRTKESAQAYRQASGTGEPRVIPMGSWLAMALQCGDLEEVRRAAAFLDERVRSNCIALREFAARQVDSRKKGAWQPSRQAADIASKAAEHAGETARRIIHAFL